MLEIVNSFLTALQACHKNSGNTDISTRFILRTITSVINTNIKNSSQKNT